MSEDLRGKLAGELLRDVAFAVLVPHLAKEVVFQVAGMPLVDAGVALARDEGEKVKGWLESGQIGRPSKETLKRWKDEDHRFAVLIVQPFVLVQEEVPKVGGVERVHWDVVESSEETLLAAIWPGPVDHDACFAEAGFTSFRDSDEAWDEEFEAITAALVEALSAYGPPELQGERDGQEPVAALLEAAACDNAPRAVVRFGEYLELSTGDGHSLFWLEIGQGALLSFEELVRRVAGGRRVDRTPLTWSALR